MPMTRREFLAELELLLNQEPGSIQGTESLDELPGWDSLVPVDLMMFAEIELGEAIPLAKLAACRSVQDLVDLLPRKIE
jgi:acyl carrier protein